jgi:flagella basal body P-ring formation protein FlgA
MTKGKWICLMTAVLMSLFSLNVQATEKLKSEIIEKVYQHYSLNRESSEIEIRKIRFKSDNLIYDSLTIEPMTGTEPRGLLPIMAYFYSEGEQISKGQVRISISHFKNVLVTVDRIKRHTPFNRMLFAEEWRDVTFLSEKPLLYSDQLGMLRAKRNIGKDQILTSGMAEIIPDVSPGKKISITYKSAGIEIRASGVALENGCVGDLIRVKNNESRKTIMATVLSSEAVEVSSH